jgi:hypothetical protein
MNTFYRHIATLAAVLTINTFLVVGTLHLFVVPTGMGLSAVATRTLGA